MKRCGTLLYACVVFLCFAFEFHPLLPFASMNNLSLYDSVTVFVLMKYLHIKERVFQQFDPDKLHYDQIKMTIVLFLT